MPGDGDDTEAFAVESTAVDAAGAAATSKARTST